MSNYKLVRRGRRWAAVFEFDADENEAIAYAFGPGDGAYAEHLKAAEEIRDLEADQ